MKKERKLLTYKKELKSLPALKLMKKDQQRAVFQRRRLSIMLGVALVVFAIMGFNLFSNSQHLSKLKNNYKDVTKEQKKVAQNEQNLEREVNLLNDTEYVEKIARAKYFYSKEGEQVYSIPDLNSSTQSSENN